MNWVHRKKRCYNCNRGPSSALWGGWGVVLMIMQGEGGGDCLSPSRDTWLGNSSTSENPTSLCRARQIRRTVSTFVLGALR